MNNTNTVYGVFIPAASTTYFDGGTIDVYGMGGIGVYMLVDNANVSMRGGSLTVYGNDGYGVLNNAGTFDMGVHDQTRLPNEKGSAYLDNNTLGYPVITLTYNTKNYGVYSAGSTSITRLYAGAIETKGNETYAIYVNDGDLQVLANQHDAAIGTVCATTFNVEAKGNTSYAMYVANGDWAIRGRGSMFTADNTALCVNDDALVDSSIDPVGNVAGSKPLSGGTFKGTTAIKVTAPDDKVGNMLLANHYLRDDSATTDYTASSDGTRLVSAAVTSVNTTVTVTDAEWELRYALELDNDINVYNMPINITLDANYLLHGTGTNDGDVNVCDATGDPACLKHILYLNGKTLDNAAAFADRQIINVGTNGDLTVEAKSWDGETPTAVAGGLIYNTNTNTGDRAILTDGTLTIKGGTVQGNQNAVSYGIYQTDGMLTVKGGQVLGGKTGDDCAIIVTGGDVEINGGVVGENTGVNYGGNTGILFNSTGTLTVNAGYIYGNYSTNGKGIYALNGTTQINGGYIYGDYDADANLKLGYTAIYVAGTDTNAVVNVATNAAHEIGTVVVAAGQFNLYDVTYTSDDVLVPSTIYAINVAGGSAYIHGGVIAQDSYVSDGEMKVDNGKFNAGLTVSGGNVTFVKAPAAVVVDDPDTDEDESLTSTPETYGTVNGTLSVSGGKLRVEYGLFNIVKTTATTADVALHGGLYSKIETAVQNNIIGAITVNETDTAALIPVNHYLIDAGGNLYRTDAASAEAASGKKMEIKNIFDEGSPYNIYKLEYTENTNYAMPCFIDLNVVSNEDDGCCYINYSFRGTERFACGYSMYEEGDAQIEISGANHTLDLNGYYLTNSYLSASASHGNGMPIIIYDGNLTVKDSKTDGRIWDTETADGSGTIRVNGGTLTVNGGTVAGSAVDGTNTGIVVYGGSVTVNNGIVEGGGQTIQMRGGALTVNGGTVKNLNAAVAEAIDVYYNTDTVSITIKGGNVTSATENAIVAEYCGNTNINITGGTIKSCEADGKYALEINNANVSVTISGGTFGDTTTTYANGVYINNCKSAKLTGGKFESIQVGTVNGTATKLIDIIPSTVTVKAADVTKGDTNYSGNDPAGDPTPEMPADKASTIISRDTVADVANLTDNSALNSTSAAPNTTKSIAWTTGEGEGAVNHTATATTSWTYAPMFTLTTGVVPGPGGGSSTTYTITASAGANGTVSPSGATSVTAGASKSYTITPATGYEVADVTVDGKSVGAVASYTFTDVKANHTISATFQKAEATGKFVDVPDSSWYNDDVYTAVDNGIMEGYDATHFGPADNATRGTIAAMIWRLNGKAANNADAGFNDLVQNWYVEAVNWAYGAGVVAGVDDEHFKPEQNVTREQLAAMLYRYAMYMKLDVTGRSDLAGFTDANSTGAYAMDAVQWAVANGIIKGQTTTTHNPTGLATRAEVAAMFNRFIAQ